MKNSDSNNWLVALLAAFAISLPLSTTSPSPDQQSSAQSQSPALISLVAPAPAPAPTQAPGQVPGEAARLLCDFFGLKPDPDLDAQGRNSGQKQAQPNAQRNFDPKNLKGDYCRAKAIRDLNENKHLGPSRYKIEYLIATLPDPKDSRLDHQFDRNLDAIRQAIEAAGYNFDRYWLPWEKSKTTAPVVLLTDPKTPQMPPRHLQEPGVILFRDSKNHKLLLLFLVGETPTGGIHRVAFQNALWQIEELAGWKESETDGANKKELRVLSPNLSGSADSLAILLKTWIHEYRNVTPPQVRIVSGSAVSANKAVLLNEIGSKGCVSFHTTVVNVREANDRFYNYLIELDPEIKRSDDGHSVRPHIALLSEAGTGLGQGVRAELQGGEQVLPTLFLTFPLHISQLRVEAAKKNPLRDEAAKALAAKDPNLALPMGEAGSSASKDIVPLFSPVETVTMELSLREMLSAIHRERIRYVGVSATDIRDRLFLVHEIRKHCPNATIFIMLNNDLLFLHSDSNLDFQGALVISPYPLFGLNQLWTYPFMGDRRRLQFSHQAAQGLYNATLALLDEPDKDTEDLMLEYGSPFKKYKAGEPRYPVLWLGIVGRNGIWPVKTFDLKMPPGETSYTLPVPAKSSSSDAGSSIAGKKAALEIGLSGSYLSPTGIGILLLIGIICLVPSLVFLIEKWNGRTLPRALAWVKRGWLEQVFGDEEFYSYPLPRHINLICCCVCLLTVTLFISSVAMLPMWIRWGITKGDALKTGWGQDLALGVVASTILVFALAALFWLVVNLIGRVISGWSDFHGRIGALSVLGGGVVMIAAVGWGLIEIFRAELPEQVFFFLRATEVTGGVSILLPGLLIGLAAFLSFFTAVRRLNLAERMPCLREPWQKQGDAPQFLHFDHDQAKSFAGLKALEDGVKEMIVCPIFEVPGAMPVAGVILIVYLGLFLAHFIPSVDGRWFDWFFKLGFYIVPLLLVLALMRFFWLWAALRRLLQRLSWHPLISKYAAGHSKEERFASLPPVDLMTHTPPFTALSVSVRQARSFYEALKFSPEPAENRKRIKELVEKAERELSLALDSDAKGDWRKALRNRRYSQATLAELTEPVTDVIEESWRTADGARPDARWRDEGKFFLITHIVAFLQHIFAHLQNLIALVTIGLLLLLVAASSYPFQPREPLRLFSWVGILTSVVVMLFIFVMLSRDKTLSLLSGTTPGKLTVTRDFVTRVLIHGVVPVVALLGVQFPEAVRQIFSWMNVFEGKGN